MISVERMENIGNEELFELFRESHKDYITLVKEIVSRWHEGKLSPALWEEFALMQMNSTASILDAERNPIDKKAFLKEAETLIDAICDDKR